MYMIAVENEALVKAYHEGYAPSGRDYELYLMFELQNLGYDVYVTKATHDFGTDVILQVNPYFRIIFQCKYYSAKIGNSAVQEICAAKEYYQAQMCVVISNQTYTDAATTLAVVNNVLLISNFDIGSDAVELCVALGLMPKRYVDVVCLQLNDAFAERSELLGQIKQLNDELFEYKTEAWHNEPLDDDMLVDEDGK